jgi:tRNA nucleotidyltransferase (CCA-adding enzyme)
MLRALCFALATPHIRAMSRSVVSFKHAHVDRNSIPIPDRLDIRLTDVESQLCNLLDDCTKHLADNGVHTSCRIAGGWVRDKVREFLLGMSNDIDQLQLLGSECHDIDIALENMTGHAFALKFTEFASKLKHLPVKSVAVVKGNPGQSKHLETAKTTVLGLDLDFVNLRDEAYADDSRIPTSIVSYHHNYFSLCVENVLDVRYAAGRRLTSGHDDELAILQCAY